LINVELSAIALIYSAAYGSRKKKKGLLMTARVLVVDDVSFNVKLLETKLMNEYYDVLVAVNGIEAIEKTRSENPDIILMDVMMPCMDGFEATKIIKTDPNLSHIPVIMVTALDTVEDRVHGLEVGADDFLTKPINDKALFARLKSLVRIKMMTDELRLRDKTGKSLGFMDDPAARLTAEVENAKVILIDDDIAQVRKITEKLSSKGISVTAVSQMDKILEEAKTGEYQLIIISNQIMDIDSLRVCSQMRSIESLRHTPILIMVGDSDLDYLTKAFEIGVNDYITTPLDSSELFARVRTQIRRYSYQAALRESYLSSVSMSVTDGLTSLYNRRYFDKHLANLLDDSITMNKSLALIIIDADHFKSVNDQYGHPAGDAVLQTIAKCLLSGVRSTDFCARYGGEEFAIILPQTDADSAKAVGERIRQLIEDTEFTIPVEPGKIRRTASIGISNMTPDDTLGSMIARADKCLYMAKTGGRNRVVTDKDESNN
jgi:two-component system cell cycle response regulator